MRSRLLLMAALSIVLTTCSGCADPGPGPVATSTSPPAAVPEPIPTPWVGDAPGELSGEVVNALLRVRDDAPGRFPETYAGVATGTPASEDVLVVYLAAPTAQVEDEVRAMAALPEAKIQIEKAYQSLEAAAVVDRQIAAAMPSLLAQGIEVQTYGVGVDGVEDLGVTHPTAEQVAGLFDRFGPYLRIDPDVGPATLL